MGTRDTTPPAGRPANPARRTLLKLLPLAAASLAGIGPSSVMAAPLRHTTIPSSGETLPPIGLGTARTFDVGPGATGRAPLKQVLRAFVEAGGRVIDTSPMYGQAETVIGELAGELGVRDKLFYATKVWTRGREAGIQQMETSMRRLGVSRIDLMQIHNLVDWRIHLVTLRDWKAQGRIRYLGITHYVNSAFDDLEAILRKETLDFVQLPYSMANREAEQRLLPLAADRGVAVLVNEPFEKGTLFSQVRGRPLPAWAKDFDCNSWAQFFLKYLLSHPAVTCPIPATSKPAHLADNMQAAAGRLPDNKTRTRMAAYMDGL